jgi:hypothetical protein
MVTSSAVEKLKLAFAHLNFFGNSQNHFFFLLHRSRKMKVAVMTRLLAKRDMNVDSAHL